MEKYKFLEGYEGFMDGILTIRKTIKPDFKSLLENYKTKVNNLNKGKDKNDYREAAFIGVGNPDAEILFVGKEMGIDTKKHPLQYSGSVEDNITRWEDNKYKTVVSNPAPGKPEKEYWPHFSPWFPYYRQNNRIRIVPKEKEDGRKTVDNNGTSRTEYFYQQIISRIYEIPEDEKQFLTLHMYAFQSELSTATAPTSAEVNPNERKQSIKNRKVLWQTPFFQNFPITILGIGPNKNYIDPDTEREDVINIVKDFNVEYYEVEYKKEEYKKGPLYIGKKFINIHFSEDGTRMLLHTSHLSASSSELIKEISVLCRKFLEGRATNQGKANVQAYLNNNDNYGK